MTVAAQFDLFARERAPMLRDRFVEQPRPLRPFQVQAVQGVTSRFAAGDDATLIVLPTGTGKTRTASEIVKDWTGPVLWVAHRTELIDQARGALEQACGELVSTEKAEQRAGGTRVVVASVQTLKGERLASFASRHPWSLMVVDEAHHAPNESYRAIRRARPGAKVLGLTATPDRSDERAMGQEFDSVAFAYEILDAIHDGYLCPIRVKQVQVHDIDLSSVGIVAGDLNQGELDAVMNAEKVIHGIVAPSGRGDSLIELAGDRRTIVFCTSVDAAHRTAEVINRYKPDSARAVDGETERTARKRILRDHDAGAYQFLCNVGVLTEGYDSPGVSCVAMCRPTKSRALYAQCAGRGLRIFPGKDDCLLLDFVGNSGKHRLASALDILGGKYDDEIVEKARDILEAQGMDGMLAEDALEKAEKERQAQREREAAKRLKIQAKNAKRVVIERDPFALLDLDDPEADQRLRGYRAEATPGQVAALEKFGVPEPAKLSKRQAHVLLDELIGNARNHMATFKQVRLLQKYGIETKGVTFDQAIRVTNAIKTNGWRRPAPHVIAAMMLREPGQEG